MMWLHEIIVIVQGAYYTKARTTPSAFVIFQDAKLPISRHSARIECRQWSSKVGALVNSRRSTVRERKSSCPESLLNG